jgi:hypothetical protein
MAGVLTGEMISTFVTSILFPKIGYVLARASHLNLVQTIISVGGAGVLGSFAFTYIFDGAITLYGRLMDKYFPRRTKRKKVFSWKSRFIIKSKKNFGMLGIAVIAPWISIPLASFLGVRFFSNRRKVFIWLSISCLAWSVAIYYLLLPLENWWRSTTGQ